MEDVFVSIDTDRLTDGTTDLNTKSLSTWLENRADRNNRCLVRNSHCVTTSKPNGITTRYSSRYYASLIPTCIHIGVYDIFDNTNSIKANILGQAQNGVVELWCELHVIRGGNTSRQIAKSESVLFNTSDLTTEVELQIDPKEITASKCIFTVWMRSVQTTLVALQSRKAGTIDWTDYKTNSHDAFLEQTGWNNFEPDHIIKDIDSGRTWQLIKYVDISGKGGGLDGRWWGIQPLDGKRINTDEWDANNDMEKHQISRFYHYSTFVSFERNPDKSTFTYAAKSPYTMQAQRPVLGQHVSQNAFNIDREHATYRMQHVGVESQYESAGLWPTEFAKSLWPTVRGGISSVSEVRFSSVGFDIEWDRPRIEISGLLLGVEVNALWTADTDKVGYPPAINRIEAFEALGPDDATRFASPQANDSVQRIKGTIQAIVRLRQLALNDVEVNLSSYEEDIPVEIDMLYWRATPDHSRPLLRTMSFAYHDDFATTKRKDMRGEYLGFRDWTITEGWLQNLNGHNDIGYLMPFVVTIDPPPGYDTTRPLIAQLIIDGPNDKTNYFSTVSEPVSLGFDVDGDDKFEDTRMWHHLVTWSVATRGILEQEI